MTTLNEIRDEAYAVAKSKGWHDEDAPRVTVHDRVALMVTELSEAMEEHRKGVPPERIYFATAEPSVSESLADPETYAAAGHKPEGIGIELADVVIRIGDAAGAHDLHLDSERTIKDWSEDVFSPDYVDKSFGEWSCWVTRLLLNAGDRLVRGHKREASFQLCLAIGVVGAWCRVLGIDIEECVRVKVAFNRTRSARHGGKRL